MKGSLALAAALLAATATTTFAAQSWSPPRVVRTSGNWNVTFYEKSLNGAQLCVLSRKETKGYYVALKGSSGGIFVQFSKPGWRIPVGTKVPVQLTFDDAAPLTIVGHGQAGWQSKDSFVSISFNDTEKDFIETFATSKELKVTFPEGSERPWSIKMSGSRELAVAFSKCYADTDKNVTQPFGAKKEEQTSKDTQPFGANKEQPKTVDVDEES